MKAYLFLWIALLLLLAAWVTGCGGGVTPIAPADDATAAPTQSDQREEPSAVPTEETQEEQGVMTPTSAPQTEEETMTPEPAPEATEVEPSTQAEGVAQLAQEDLARRLELESDAIGVISVEAVDWPDASLGCPQPGMMYAQVITPGFLVVLEAEGGRYEYHTDAGRFMVLCGEDGSPLYPVIPINPDEIQDGKPWMPAD